ncbi:hypothetical protein QF035_000335 [Streptomyces umbrinus]|uniref:Uncharacterized protein n=1 Tax=Streptomyces umbrinus TaxID=67370 RepID=A0ABU0SGQ8_9ACTN|nr:hypothetical protein [Streptomyces umbrinus]
MDRWRSPLEPVSTSYVMDMDRNGAQQQLLASFDRGIAAINLPA